MKKQILLIALLPLLAPMVAHAQKIPLVVPKADEPNARLELARAAKALHIGSEEDLERGRELVANNAEALQIIRGALQLPFRAAPLPEAGKFSEEELMEMTGDNNVKPMARYRFMARLLVMESRVRAADKDFVGAMQSALDAQRLGMLVQSDGPLAQILVGSALESSGCHQLRVLLPQSEIASLKIALRELSQRLSTAPTYAHTLRATAAWDLLFYKLQLQGVPQPVAQQMLDEWQRLSQAEIAQSQVAYIISAQQARVDIFSEEYIEDLGEEVPLPDALTADVVPAEVVTDLVAKQFAVNRSYYHTSRLLYEKNQAQNALLLAELALRAYELEHTKPATSWAELVPAYLAQAPADPFDYEQSLRLATRDGKTVAYSIGPDGLDDKGAPIDAGADAAARRFRVEFNSRGDIVSGINLQ